MKFDLQSVRLETDIRKLRKALEIDALTQGMELAKSAGIVAARYSFPLDRARSGGGARLSKQTAEDQKDSIMAAIYAYSEIYPEIRRASADVQMETANQLVAKHAGRVRAGQKIRSARAIVNFSDARKAKTTESAIQDAIPRLQKRVGPLKASWVKAAFSFGGQGKTRIPAYISAHLGHVKASGKQYKREDGEYDFVLTNQTQISGRLWDETGARIAAMSAAKGQLLRYRKQLSKKLKEAIP